MHSSSEIRQAFLDYFAAKGHEIVPSSPLIPANDPTLLFTNAGMVQFKDSFLGRETRRYVRAASSQLCVRAGGKHNDLENVGYTARHHTFFEMLGNFSFGDYFKAEAIAFAWEFLTQVLKLPAEKLWVTVYADDDEAARIWLDDMGLDPARFSRIGDKPGGRQYESDNFWSMGDTGPCGPCSEIFYDHGPDIWGGPPGTPDEDGDRYIEIWNLVFMQYERDASGALTPLPKPSVDTGMGLERLSAVLQQVHSNYEIDLFAHLIRAAAGIVGTADLTQKSLRVIADHIRSSAFLILDGVLPSNEGRGYVLRRIIRRAIRHGYQLGQTQAFFHAMVQPLVEVMGAAYPHLATQAEQITRVLLKEESRFAETLEQGMRILNTALAELQGKTLPGELVFRLYDTYGFPVDLTADIAREQGLALDMAGFEQAMQAQRERARAASNFATKDSEGLEINHTSHFDGYHQLSHQARLVALYRDGIEVESLFEGQDALALLDTTPFYAESGGQIGDTGLLVADSGQAEVLDTRKKNHAILHHIRVKTGELGLGQTLDARVDAQRRQAVVLNHSATHLMHAALRKVLGTHVQQKGSLVAPDRLRFDFAHFEPMTQNQIAEVEHLVNAEIRANAAASERLMSKDAAMAAGAMALFGEKYGDEVRVISIGDFSTELCGGCHVERAGDIGLFKIMSEAGVAAGVRRLEAVTGEQALRQIAANEGHLEQVATLLKTSRDEVDAKVVQLLERNRRLEKELEALKARLASSKGSSLIDQSIAFDGFKLLAAELEGADAKTLRETMDQLKNKLGSAIILLASVTDAKVSLVAGVTQDLTDRFKAGDLIRDIAAQVGGKGGGRADMAQAGGNEPAALPKALTSVETWVRARL